MGGVWLLGLWLCWAQAGAVPPGVPPATLSIEVDDAAVSGVLRLISAVTGQAYVLDGAHDRRVTLRLVDVEAEAALHAVLAVAGLRAEEVAGTGVVRVVPR